MSSDGARTDDRVEQGPAPTPPARRMPGTWRSLVISMIVIGIGLLAWMALTPRPERIDQPPVDVSASARGVAQQTGWPLRVPSLGDPWRATNVRFGDTRQGLKTWQVGYARTDRDDRYISVAQTRGGADAKAVDAWIADQVKQGSARGQVDVAGASWDKYVLDDKPARNSLVLREAGTGMIIVVSGLAEVDDVQHVAATLSPATRPTATTG